jgi:ribonuclease HI
VKIFFDGGCRPAPWGMATALVARGQTYLRSDLGEGSAMEAEWRALLDAVALAETLGEIAPLLLGDALAVIRQATGTARCPPRFAGHLAQLRASPVAARLRYIKRTQNLAGIALDRIRNYGRGS